MLLQVPGLVQDILYLTAMLNTTINPLIYGVYYFSEKFVPVQQRRFRHVKSVVGNQRNQLNF